MKLISIKSWALLCLSMAGLLSVPYVFADIAGVKMGFAAWNHQPGGTVRYQGTDTNAETGLNLTDEAEGFFWMAIEHPVPGLPNIKIGHTKLNSTGNGNSTISFGGINFNGLIDTSLKLDQTDLTLYYELVDTAVHFDLGLTIKYIDGTAQVASVPPGQLSRVDFEGVLPLIYASLDFKMPLTGLSFGIEGNALSYNGHRYTDVQLRLAYESKAKMGVQLGYRRMQLKLDDLDGVFSDLKFDGPFAAVFFHF